MMNIITINTPVTYAYCTSTTTVTMNRLPVPPTADITITPEVIKVDKIMD